MVSLPCMRSPRFSFHKVSSALKHQHQLLYLQSLRRLLLLIHMLLQPRPRSLLTLVKRQVCPTMHQLWYPLEWLLLRHYPYAYELRGWLMNEHGTMLRTVCLNIFYFLRDLWGNSIIRNHGECMGWLRSVPLNYGNIINAQIFKKNIPSIKTGGFVLQHNHLPIVNICSIPVYDGASRTLWAIAGKALESPNCSGKQRPELCMVFDTRSNAFRIYSGRNRNAWRSTGGDEFDGYEGWEDGELVIRL